MKIYFFKNNLVTKFVKIILILTMFSSLLISQKIYAADRTSAATGDWSALATWDGGTSKPAIFDTVTIVSGHNVTVNEDTANLTSLTVNNGGTLTQGAFAIATGSFTVDNGGAFTQGGNLNVAGNTDVTLATWTIQGGTFSPTGTVDVTGNLTINSTLTQGANAVTVSGNLIIGGAGVFTANAAATDINVGGNWANTGTFTPNGSTVVFTDADHTLSGSTTFNNFTHSVGTSRTLTFTAGTTQTISGLLTLNGASGQLLNLRSTGAAWNIDRAGTYNIDYVDVQYSNNTGTAISVPASSNTNSGNNSGWTFTVPASIPTLSEWGMIIFTMLLGASAVFAIRRRNIEDSI
jgi:IPTL-CTERM motif